ncbi:MAG: hypothetical protein H0U21_15400 [Acidimicrobiia bacterium]|nr:hypothetical protein [Acidimicrobiia bacterium]
MRYEVQAIRSGKWRATEFPGVDERMHSQARRLDQVQAMAADALTMWFADEDGRTVSAIDVDVEVVLDGELRAVVDRAAVARAHVEAASVKLRSASRDAVQAMASVASAGARRRPPSRRVVRVRGEAREHREHARWGG